MLAKSQTGCDNPLWIVSFFESDFMYIILEFFLMMTPDFLPCYCWHVEVEWHFHTIMFCDQIPYQNSKIDGTNVTQILNISKHKQQVKKGISDMNTRG